MFSIVAGSNTGNGSVVVTGPGSLTVAALIPPQLSKGFGAPAIPLGASTSLTFTISNSNVGAPLTGIAFTDMLPGGLTVASGSSSPCGGTLTTTAPGTISFSGGSVGANSNCQIAVTVTGAGAGLQNNVTGNVTSTDGGTGNTASASITVVAPPSIGKKFDAATIPLKGRTTLTVTITNPNTTTILTGVAFSDTLPSGLTFDGFSIGPSCGNVIASESSSGLSVTDITISPNSACVITAPVIGTSAGLKNNVTSAVTSSNGGTGNTASASITVVAPPSISKAFGASSIAVNGTTSLTFTLTNPNTSTQLTGVGFTDALPSGLTVASGSSTVCGGTLATTAPGTVSFSGGTIPASSNCQISVTVTGATPGLQNNVTGKVTSTNGGSGNTGSASITVLSPPSISKSFGAASIAVGGTTSLTFTITNPNTSTALTGVAFTDALPSGLTVTSGTSTVCGGTLTTTAPGTVSLSGGTIASSSNCQVIVTVTGATPGVQNNVTGAVTSTNGGSGNTGSASITVLSPPSISKSFGAATVAVGGTTNLTFTITNPNTSTALTGVAFTDALPSGLTVASGTSTVCGGTLTTAAPGTISFSGGALAASSNCQIVVTVTGATPGVQNNVTGNVTSANAGTGNTGSASITVLGPPSISKSFNPNKFIPGGTSTLSIVISNPNASGTLTGIGFTDTLPSGMTITTPSNNLTNTCSSTPVATPGSNQISLSGASLKANSSCTITVTVTATPDGVYNNQTSAVSSSNGGNGQPASASATVASPPSLTKTFSAASIPAGGSTTLTFTVANPNHNVSLTGISFTDPLPTGLQISTPNGLTGTCDGTITATPGTATVSLSGASLSPQTNCTFSVNVTATATGALVNTTGPITSDQTVPGAPASATINVGSVFLVNYAANLNAGDSVLDLVNVGENGASLDGPGLGAATGNLCVNVYALDPQEELLSCCSCLITPDGLASLSVNNDILSNTATGAKPTSIVIKLVTTLAGGNGTATNCSNAATTVGTLASGLAAWRTTLHATPLGTDVPTETAFTPATLSEAELASLTYRCRSIVGNGSGAGICNSCSSTGLGAAKDTQ